MWRLDSCCHERLNVNTTLRCFVLSQHEQTLFMLLWEDDSLSNAACTKKMNRTQTHRNGTSPREPPALLEKRWLKTFCKRHVKQKLNPCPAQRGYQVVMTDQLIPCPALSGNQVSSVSPLSRRGPGGRCGVTSSRWGGSPARGPPWPGPPRCCHTGSPGPPTGGTTEPLHRWTNTLQNAPRHSCIQRLLVIFHLMKY